MIKALPSYSLPQQNAGVSCTTVAWQSILSEQRNAQQTQNLIAYFTPASDGHVQSQQVLKSIVFAFYASGDGVLQNLDTCTLNDLNALATLCGFPLLSCGCRALLQPIHDDVCISPHGTIKHVTVGQTQFKPSLALPRAPQKPKPTTTPNVDAWLAHIPPTNADFTLFDDT